MVSVDKLVSEARRNLGVYAVSVFPEFIFGSHHEQLILALMLLERGIIKRLIVTMPPRHGKSLLTSEIFPSWYLGRNPGKAVILTSYSGSLAWTFGKRVRENMQTPIFRNAFGGPGGANLDPRRPAQIIFPGFRGGFLAAGVGGGITGRGADLFIIDDPIKDAAQAMSMVYRQRLWEWYTSTAYTRLMPGASLCVIQTRWHEDDLTGRILDTLKQSDSEDWYVLHMPAIDADGNALWPERFPLPILQNIRAAVGERVWQALYQGYPSPPEGIMVRREWLKLIDRIPEGPGIERVRYWDLASTEGDGDYTTGVLMSRTQSGAFVIEHVVRGQWSPAKRNIVMRRVSEYDRARFGNVKIFFEQEGGSAGVDVSLAIKQLLGGFPVEAHKPTTAKAVRFDPFRAQAEVGNVYFVRGPWNKDWLDEITGFPYQKHDDQVDGTSGAFNKLAFNMSNYGEYLRGRYGLSDPAVAMELARIRQSRVEDELGIQENLTSNEGALLRSAIDNAGVRDYYDESYFLETPDKTIVNQKYELYIQDNDHFKPGALDFILRTYFNQSLVRSPLDRKEFYKKNGNYVIAVHGNPQLLADSLESSGYAKIHAIAAV